MFDIYSSHGIILLTILSQLKYCHILIAVWLLFQVSRLIYTNSGFAILALASNAVHKLWKWPRNDRNMTGKVLFWKVDISEVGMSIHSCLLELTHLFTGDCKYSTPTMATFKWDIDDE